MIKRPLFLLLILMVSVLPAALAARELLDRVVAVVNDEPITQSEIDFLLRPVYREYKEQFEGRELIMKLNEARRKLLNQLIEDRLVFQEAKEREIRVEEAEIDRRMKDFRARFENNEKMEKALADQGVSLKDIRERFRRQAMIQKLHDREIRSKVIVSPKEVEDYYRDHPGEFSHRSRIKVRSITIKKSPQAREKGMMDETAMKKIKAIREEVFAGRSFEDLAAQYSEDIHAASGGLGDWIEQGSMIPEIDEVIFSMKVGELSEIIETPMGYHLFRVDDLKEGNKRTLEQCRDEIFAKIYRQKGEKRFLEWMQQLKRNAYISIK